MTICKTTRTLRLEYSRPVRDCMRVLRVFPAPQRAGQSVLQLDWKCDPAPDSEEESSDEFGNRVLQMRHRLIAKSFHFEMQLRTSCDATIPIARETNQSPNGIGAWLLPSALCDWTPTIEAAARELKGAAAPDVCDFVYRALEYSTRATNVETSASQSLQYKRGVCQDFAHVMISLCRALKIPARYVSGYLPGEGAPHAWCEILENDVWRGFDPTHNRSAREDYVFVSCGRDFRDCAPTSGKYRGRARAQLHSFCKTEIVAN